MQEENNNVGAEAVEDSQETPTVTLIDKGDIVLKLEAIDEGKFKGFQFNVPSAKTLDGAIRHFTTQSQDGKDGEDVVLGLVNAALVARMRSRANSKLTPPQKIDGVVLSLAQKEAFVKERLEWLGTDKQVLVSEEDAFTYVPGEREVDSISGLQRQVNELTKLVTKLAGEIKVVKEKGDSELVSKLTVEVRAHYAKLNEKNEEIAKRQTSDLDNLKSVFGLE